VKWKSNKNPRGKPSRLTLDFLVSLESWVFNGTSFIIFSPQGAGNKTRKDLISIMKSIQKRKELIKSFFGMPDTLYINQAYSD